MADARQRLLLHNIPFEGISFHPRLPTVLVAEAGGATLWDLEHGDEISRIPLNGTPRCLGFAPGEERFAATYAVGRDWVVSVHRITGELLASNVFDKLVPTFAWHPSGDWLAVPDYSGRVYRMDAKTGEKRVLGGHKAEAARAEFSPDGDYLITGGWERELICWDARTLKRAFTAFLNGFAGRFNADGRIFALETQTGVQLHAFERAGGHHEFAEDLGPRVLSAAFSPDNRWLAAAGREQLGVWDLQNGGPGALATNAGDTRVVFAANGELFADRRGAAFRWRVSPGADATSTPKLEPLELAVPAGFVSLCPVSNGVVLSGARGSALVSQEQLGAGPREWKRSVDGLNGVSPDGRWLAMYRSFTPHVVVHRLPDLERVAILTNASSVLGFEFSPAAEELAVSCRLGGVEFWSTATWRRTRTITNLNHPLYSADGRTMWLTQQFRAGGLHAARTLDLLLPLPVGTYPLAVSPDGRRLAVSVDLRRLQVWDLAEVRRQLGKMGLDWRE